MNSISWSYQSSMISTLNLSIEIRVSSQVNQIETSSNQLKVKMVVKKSQQQKKKRKKKEQKKMIAILVSQKR